MALALLGGAVIICLAVAMLSSSRAWLWLISVVTSVVVVVGSNPFRGTDFHYLWPIASAIAFLIVAVPLGELLDEVGFFRALASLIPPKYAFGLLWALAAVVTTILNLDAAIVLLTPLYYRYALANGIEPLPMVAQPLILSLLGSSALSVSNLTNLIFVGVTSVSSTSFLTYLGIPSLGAVIVGYVLWRIVFRSQLRVRNPISQSSSPISQEQQRRALEIGGITVVVLLIGFVLGPSVGVQPFEVVTACDLALIALTRRFSPTWIAFRPAVTISGVVVVALAFGEHISLHQSISSSPLSVITWTGIAAVTATLLNNIPAVASLLVILRHAPIEVRWGVLLGVNMGPSLLFVGTLASILWLSIVGKLKVKVTPATFAILGAKVSIPSFVIAAVLLAVIGRVS